MVSDVSRPAMTELDVAIRAAEVYPGDRVCGIDVAGRTAIACVVPVAVPLRPVWLAWRSRHPGTVACRQIAAQASMAFRSHAFAGCSAVWIEQPFGQISAVAALSRTVGAIAGVCPFRIPVDMISASEWRKALGIRGGAGVKERAQLWAQAELVGVTQSWQRVADDDNAADAYGIARAILATRETIRKG